LTVPHHHFRRAEGAAFFCKKLQRFSGFSIDFFFI